MATCLDTGGTPASRHDLVNSTEVKVKEGTTVWTADYTYFEGQTTHSRQHDLGLEPPIKQLQSFIQFNEGGDIVEREKVNQK